MSASAIPEKAVEAGARAVDCVAPTCDRCGVEYVEGFSGDCQEPLGPHFDGSRTCGGQVKVQPAAVAAAVLEAANASLQEAIAERLLKQLEEKWPNAASDEFKNGYDDAAQVLEAAIKEAMSNG